MLLLKAEGSEKIHREMKTPAGLSERREKKDMKDALSLNEGLSMCTPALMKVQPMAGKNLNENNIYFYSLLKKKKWKKTTVEKTGRGRLGTKCY